ncbi:uncharacterized protein HD556DRAFT_1312812 [Suillus plorans]|uniref:Uncharacterized protein n=1 Tax=Suillus plorans TaxID=116603 RepID=A0A9P7ADV2_9AGAM|nr:uncharacterized protein HD556DRAFT_1312812 [Suillus plorans]KAG1787352.1 hypothetical protein HD556DRAFT_1312812 [Suillus plorans]
MPPIQHNQGEDFTQAINDVNSDSTRNSDGTDSLSDSDLDDDADLMRIRDTIAAPTTNMSTQDLRKALEIAQKFLFDMHGKYRESLKKIALLEATVSKGRKTKLTKKDLALAAKEDSIRNFGRKFSITHCLWVETSIFPLRESPPRIDLSSKERWLSPLSIQDGIKAELFQFIPPADHNMMAHKNFGSHFVKGVNNVRAEMLSDVKSCAAAIFGLDAKFFICGYARDTEPSCKSLLLNPQGQYTKFAPILFPRPDHLLRDQFLKTAKLVYILKASLFGRSSLAANTVPTPKTKAKIWELRAVTPGLIAAAAIVAIFVLSGDKELVEVGDKSRIPYKDYHNYYRQSLLTGGAWADGVFTFFNNSLFSTSSATTLLDSDSTLLGDLTSGPCDSWEEMFEHAMETGVELPELNMIQTSSVGPVIEASSSAPGPQSISAAMQGLALAEHLPPAAVDKDVEAEPVAPVAAQKPKPKPKPRRKGKAAAADSNISEDQAPANVEPEVSSLVVSGSGVRRGRSKTTK